MDAYESTREYWKSKDVSSQEALAAELQTYMVLFAWQNCLLEDLDVSADEVRAAFFEDGAQTPGEAGRLLANQRRCFELLLPLAAAGEDLTPELVERVNALLCEGMDIEADDEDDSLTPEELRGWYTMKGFYFEKPIRDFELLKSPALADEIAGGLRRLKPLFVLMRDLVPIEDEDDAVRPMDRV